MLDDDYIIVEHKRSPNPFLRGSGCREHYELLAGKMPAWANFPAQWAEWVDGPARGTAIKALRRLSGKVEGLKALIDYACQKRSKNRISAAWADVQAAIEGAGYLRYTPKHTYTWTGVRAKPIRIAEAVDWKAAGLRRWIPKGKPRFQENNAILAASPEIAGYINSNFI
jgi:hypothetical protein